SPLASPRHDAKAGTARSKDYTSASPAQNRNSPSSTGHRPNTTSSTSASPPLANLINPHTRNPERALPPTDRTGHDWSQTTPRSSSENTVSPVCPSAKHWPPRCCTATPATPKPSPGSAGASTNGPWEWSPVRSAPARPSRSAQPYGRETMRHDLEADTGSTAHRLSPGNAEQTRCQNAHPSAR